MCIKDQVSAQSFMLLSEALFDAKRKKKKKNGSGRKTKIKGEREEEKKQMRKRDVFSAKITKNQMSWRKGNARLGVTKTEHSI